MRAKDIIEGVGRITKQNQTVDVGPDEVTKQAAKFGNKVDKDGRPPTLSKKVKGKSTNVAFNLGMVEGKQIPNPKNTFLSKSDTAYDFIRVGKSISNLSNAKKSDNRDEPDVMIVPFGGKKEKDHLKKGLKKAGYKTQDADKPGDDAQVDEASDLVLDKESLIKHLQQAIKQYAQEETDIEKLSYILQKLNGKTVKTRSNTHFTVTDEDIQEALRRLSESSDCPPATQDLELNTKNRDATLKNFNYGPLNVSEPGDYWEKIAEYWKTDIKAAKTSNCGNCVAFDISRRMDDCMPGETSDEFGRLGYCWMHHFKCHSARSCHTWAKGGPIVDDEKSLDWQKRGEDKVKENFADGKKKGKSRPGRVKKSGASCNGSVTALRKKAKKASGERARMYHWCANMKGGKKK